MGSIDLISLEVLILTHNRIRALERCLDSIFSAARAGVSWPAHIRISISVAINGPDEKSMQVLNSLSLQSPWPIQYHVIPRRALGAARNLFFSRSQADWILFIDDDVTLPIDLFKNFVDLYRAYPKAGVMGGPNWTLRPCTHWQWLQGEVLGSFIGSGPFFRRYRSSPEGETHFTSGLTLCNLFVRTQDPQILFLEKLKGGEEINLLHRLKKQNVRFLYSSRLGVFHERRDGLKSLWGQMLKYGTGRVEVAQESPLWPVTLGAFVMLIFGFAFAIKARPNLIFQMALIYFAAIAINSLFIFVRQKRAMGDFARLLILHLIIHFGYIGGLFVETLKGLSKVISRPLTPRTTELKS